VQFNQCDPSEEKGSVSLT